jgi:drug/metabolite transporter (DMT)-like permease
MKLNTHIKGVIFIVLAVLMYGLYAVFSRFINDYLGPFTQNYLRSFLIIGFFSIYILITNQRWEPIKKRDLKWLSIWTISGSVTVVLAFIVFNNMPISTAYFIFYSTMIITGFIVGAVLFKEKMNKAKIISIALLLVALLLIYKLEFKLTLLPFILLSLLMGALIGLWNTISKKVSSRFSVIQMTLMGAIVTSFISIVGSLIMHETIPNINNGALIWVVAFGAAEILATLFVILGFKNLEAQIASTIMPLEIVFATLFGVVFFQEYLTFNMLIGGVLILFAGMLPSLWEFKFQKDKYVEI